LRTRWRVHPARLPSKGCIGGGRASCNESVHPARLPTGPTGPPASPGSPTSGFVDRAGAYSHPPTSVNACRQLLGSPLVRAPFVADTPRSEGECPSAAAPPLVRAPSLTSCPSFILYLAAAPPLARGPSTEGPPRRTPPAFTRTHARCRTPPASLLTRLSRTGGGVDAGGCWRGCAQREARTRTKEAAK
jgi:hypothetical protein